MMCTLFNLDGVSHATSFQCDYLPFLPTDEEDEDAPLLRDIEMLSSMLADVVKKDNPHVHELFEQLRKHGLDRANNPDDIEAFKQMKKLAYDLSPV